MKNMQMREIIAMLAVLGALTGCGGGGPGVASNPIATPSYHATEMPDAARRAATAQWIGTGIGSTLSPTDVRTHYNFPSALVNTGAGQTIAIVDAPGSGNIRNDLNTFSAYYGLPQCSASPCFFSKTDLSNGAVIASKNDWATEIALDVEWAHAMAPGASIVLVVAKSSGMIDMMNAVSAAAAIPGVVAVSMSWGAPEFSNEAALYDSIFSAHPGVVFLASSGDTGDNGSNQIYPAASPYVTSVGGSSIKTLALPATSSSETAWSLGGGGASIYESMPVYQSNYLAATNKNLLTLNNGKRAIPDIAYNADPSASPVGVFVNGSWWAVGGTSAGAPQWAAITAQLGQYLSSKSQSVSSVVMTNAGFNNILYKLKSGFYDVTLGSDNTGRRNCSLCTAGTGYDDVSGLGTPNVTNIFGSF
jgi:subtilase family serine protease